MEAQLAAERAARETAERKILALKTEKRILEYRVINAHRTLAHGLGRALIEARSLKGLLALPGKIRRLRAKQKAKRRERVPNSFAEDVAAHLHLVDPVLDRAAAEGAEAAAEWAGSRRDSAGAKARALAELAHWTLDRDPALAARLGRQAADLDPGDQRLLALAVRLREAGRVAAPGPLCLRIRDRQPLSEGQRHLCDLMTEDAAILEKGRWEGAAGHGERRASGESGLAIVCPPGWAALPRIAAARAAATSAGWPSSVLSSIDDTDSQRFSLVHVFADSVPHACEHAATAVARGCRVIVEIANPPAPLTSQPDSELAAVTAMRLKGLAELADTLIARSPAASAQLDRLDIDHRIVADTLDTEREAPDSAAIAAALVEYGATTDMPAIGLVSPLNGDPGIHRCLEAFAKLSADGDTYQLLIFGKGDYTAELAQHAEALDIAGNMHFVGLPPPQRWPALLAALDLVTFPNGREEALGSVIPAIFVQAMGQGGRVLATDAAWRSQAAWKHNPSATLDENGDWAARIAAMIGQQAEARPQPAAGDLLVQLYADAAKPL
ncbi:glycosyltransferase [Parasphingopyxis algicola]|uniref:glycosyltransferase n=1 Tax=Parasphingopyxis algicola TaxID=2026624 RepID=UPI0015A14461|nr:glycosyltransferase [Parasphingopyxis algicola]QLC23668.1 glycosyltransferase [Parasphingopyxis algicola]